MLSNLLAVFENLTPLDTDNILRALNIFWRGALAVFLAIVIIIIAVTLIRFCITKAEAWNKKRKEKKSQDGGEDGTPS